MVFKISKSLTCIFIVISIVTLALTSFGQNKQRNVTGVLIDSINKVPVSYGTVSVVGKNLRKSMPSDQHGKFSINFLIEGDLEITVSAVGYLVKTIKLSNKSFKDSINLGNVTVSPETKDLKTVNITASKPLINQQIDKLTYDVQADLESKTGTTLDILRKVPLVQLSLTGGLTVNGANSFLVLLNGKPYALYKTNPIEALRNLMAMRVKSIEVYTTPASRFTAQGYTEVINIITLSNPITGFLANVSNNTTTLGATNSTLTIDSKYKKIGLTLYTNGSYNNDPVVTSSSSLSFKSTNRLVKQEGEFKRASKYLIGQPEISYELDSLNLLLVNLTAFNNRGNIRNHYSLFDYNLGALVNNQAVDNIRDYNNGNIATEIYYQNEGKKNHSRILTIGYKYTGLTEDNQFDNQLIQTKPGSDKFLATNMVFSGENQAQVNYVLPGKLVTYESGARATFRMNKSESSRSQFIASTNDYAAPLIVDPLSVYHQDIYSIYQSTYFRWKTSGLKVMATLERTDIDYVSSNNFKSHYFNIIPSVNYQKVIKKSTINFSYSQAIERPSVYEINPFVDRSNPNYVTAGNPDLKPAVQHTFGTTFSVRTAKLFIRPGLQWVFGRNPIEAVVSPISDTSVLATFKNVGSFDNINLNFFATIRPGKQIDISVSGALSHLKKEGVYLSQQYTNEGYRFTSFTTGNYTTKNNWRLSLSLTTSSPDILLQGNSFWQVNMSAGINKRFLKNKLGMTAILSNPFQQYRIRYFNTNSDQFIRLTSSRESIRGASITLSYKIGGLKYEIKKNNQRIETSDLQNQKKL